MIGRRHRWINQSEEKGDFNLGRRLNWSLEPMPP
jgi:hypothetical protein